MVDYNDILVTKMLSGPISLTFFKDVYGKDFYIFGDEHHTKTEMCKNPCNKIGECLHIVKYFEMIFKKAPYKIDFFLEIPFIDKDHVGDRDVELIGLKKNKDMIEMISSHFKKCFLPNKNYCEMIYKNVRFHYSDIRTKIAKKSIEPSHSFFRNYFMTFNAILEIKPLAIGYISRLLDLQPKVFKQFLTKYIGSPSLQELYKEVILNMKSIKDFPTFLDYKTSEINEDNNRIKKQIDGIKNKIIKKKIVKFYKDNCKIICDNYLKAYKKLRVNIENRERILKNGSYLWDDVFIAIENSAHEILLSILYAGALIMDIYTLARIFKPSDGKEVWMYVGDYHAQNYIVFLKHYLGEEKFITSKNIKRRCLFNTSRTKIKSKYY